MPRAKSGVEPTPFATVLTDYMAKQRPIWTTGRLARAIGERRQTIGNWMYHDVTPPLEKMLTILATLKIPISALLDAYRLAGVPTPALDYEDAAASTTAGSTAQRTQQAIATESGRAAAEQQRWETMIANTRTVLEATGFPQAALDGLLASIEASHAGEHPLARQIEHEHREPRQTRPAQSVKSVNPANAEGPEGDEPATRYAGTTRSPAAQRAAERTSPATSADDDSAQ